jgi:beta-N-acetylhexosaminidase
LVSLTFRPYDPTRDQEEVYTLWQVCLGHLWPLSRAAFQSILIAEPVYEPGDHLLVLLGSEPVGFVATQSRRVDGDELPRGEIMLIMVDPAYQRRGLGRELLGHALETLAGRGVSLAQLGGGGISYFWPGVPANLPGAWAFFSACGWQALERSYDLVLDLDRHVSPQELGRRTIVSGIQIRRSRAADAQAVLAFERDHFPTWKHAYREVIETGAFSDVVLAQNRDREIVGTCLLLPPNPDAGRPWFPWESLLGEQTAGVACLGVAEHARGKGIGLALVTRVTELLKARGAQWSYVGWTWLVDWYGRLGYEIWRTYLMSRKSLDH